MIEITEYTGKLRNYLLVYGLRVLVALLILIIGLWLIKRITVFLNRIMRQHA